MAKAPVLTLTESGASVENGFVSFTLNTAGGAWIESIAGDFSGHSSFGGNLITEDGFRLERENDDGSVVSASGQGPSSLSSLTVKQNDDECVVLELPAVVDQVTDPLVSETWTVSLCADSRFLSLQVDGHSITSSDVSSLTSLRSVRHSLYSSLVSTTAFYELGVVQILNAPTPLESFFGSTDLLRRAYLLGGDERNGNMNGCLDLTLSSADSAIPPTMLLNADGGEESPLSFRSGLQALIIGGISEADFWAAGYSDADNIEWNRSVAITYAREFRFAPNNRNFPAGQLPVGSVSNLDNNDDLATFMTGIYANAVPCLCTYPNEVTRNTQVAQIATTLRHEGGRGYNHTYNYFDPDNFFGLSAILYSGDEYLLRQARMVIERSGAFIKNSTGQLPHHFEGVKPTYLALSGETQTGPNTFWVMTALQYVAVSGDYNWLSGYMDVLRTASSFVFDLIDPEKHLLLAPGSLMIDVFIRNNYTSDSNSMLVGFLRNFAAAERVMGNTDRAQELEDEAVLVTQAVNNYLWAAPELGGDHYVTQLNVDGSIRDFVDYDSNVIAVANDVANATQAQLIFARIDSGSCSAGSGGGPQWVSEKYYGVDDTTNGNIGDSSCAMARIGWFDAVGRKSVGGAESLRYFEERVLTPVQRDVLQYTWLHERYGCDGLQQENRTMYYFEYPSLAAMLLREIKYGLKLSVDGVTLAPFNSNMDAAFEYHIGNIDVIFAPKSTTSISVPGATEMLADYQLAGLLQNCDYFVRTTDSEVSITVRSSATGELRFTAPRAPLPFAVLVTAAPAASA